jgi:hypothetical protein
MESMRQISSVARRRRAALRTEAGTWGGLGSLEGAGGSRWRRDR